MKLKKEKKIEKREEKPVPQPGDVRKPIEKDEQKELRSKKLNKKEKKDITKELINIYKEPDGRIPDMSKIEHKKRSKLKLVLVSLVIFFAFLAGLSWLGFFIFFKPQKFSGEGVKLEITAPTEAAGGEEITYLISYTNGENVPLGQAEIEVYYSDDFVFFEAEPKPMNSKNNLWSLGSLPAGKNGQIKIKGQIFGEFNSSKTLRAVMTYKPADFNSNFQKISQAVTEIKNSFLEISAEGPEKILVNDKISYKIKYKNISELSFNNLKVKVIYPENFIFDSSKPEGFEGDNSIWLIDSLDSQEEGEIEVVGAFVGDVEGSKELKAQIGFALDGSFYLQKEFILTTEVIKGEALLTLIINGDNKDQAINFGEVLSYSIAYKNNSQVTMENAEIKISIETTSKNDKGLLDWKSLIDENNGQVIGSQISENVRAATIVWTKKQIKDLALLEPGKEGIINFQVKVKDYEDVKGWEFENFEIKNLAEMKIEKMGGITSSPKIVQSNAVNFKLNSDFNLIAFARYFNDDNMAVGYGPIPPKVGETTAYRIFWKLTNSLHEIKNIKVSAILPDNVKWSEKFEIEAGEIKFNPVTREIVWTLNRLPKDVESVKVNFEITVKPLAKDVGKILTLLPSVGAVGTDKETEGLITLESGELNSDLKGDPQVEGKGIVVE